MISPTPRVIAIDDEPEHLDRLTEALNRLGTACLPIHFTGETAHIPPCPHVRIIFADLHLGGGPQPEEHTQNFGVIGGLLQEVIKPSGPYLIVLWTMYPEQANKLHNHLERLQSVSKPFAVKALNKNTYIDSQAGVKDTESLLEAIQGSVTEQPQIRVLFNWEERALGAAAGVLSSVIKLAERAANDGQLSEEVGRLLVSLAVAAVGEKHAGEDWFRAVNEGLLPILGDSIASMRSETNDREIWQTALEAVDAGYGVCLNEAARLNRLLHLDLSTSGSDGVERGTVIRLSEEFSEKGFEARFGIAPEAAATEQFSYKWTQNEDNPLYWVLVQTQAACDYAQAQPGPLPFHLGLCLSASKIRKNKKPPSALWRSPCFEIDDLPAFIHINARFQISLTVEEAKKMKPFLRLREQLLNNLIYQIHGYGARPGIISFRGSN